MIAASGDVPKRPVMSGGRLEREVIAGELKNVKPMTKLRRERYLWPRWGTTELLSVTMRIDKLWSGDFKGDSASSGGVQKERERERGRGSTASFIG